VLAYKIYDLGHLIGSTKLEKTTKPKF
jgi:hypothetical protein